MIIIPFLSLLGYSFLFGKITKSDYFRHVATAIGFIVFNLYIAAFFDQMLAVSKILYIIGLCLFWILFFKEKNKIKEDIVTQIPFFCVLIIILLTIKSFQFHALDDFSHWGVIAKEIFLANGLPKTESTAILFSQYPPATAIFGYFMLINTTSLWIEWMMIFAQSVILFSGLMFLLTLIPKNLSLKNKILGSVLIIIMYLSYAVIMLLGLQIDQIMGVLMFIIIGSYITGNNKLDIILPIFFISILLSIFKLSSMPLLIICLAVILTARWTKKEYKIPTLEIIGIFILIFIISYLFRHFWSLHMNFLTSHSWHNNGQWKLVLTGHFWLNYIKHFIGYIFGHGCSILTTVLTFINLFCLRKFKIIDKKQYFAIIISLFCAYALYLFALLFTYITIFGWFEILSNPPSMNRYMYTLIMMLFGVDVLMLFYSGIFEKITQLNNYKKHFKLWLFSIICICFCLLMVIFYKVQERKKLLVRKEIAQIANIIKNSGKNIIIFYEGFTNKECFIFRYEMAPKNMINTDCAKISNNIGIVSLSDDQAREIITDCNSFIYIPKGDEVFKKKISNIFQQKCNLSAKFL